jgi:ABC-type phosphate/phosphonate transport system substrate-binding protein
VVHIDNFRDAYQGLLSGRCQAAVIPAVMVQKLDQTNATRVIFQSSRYPNPGFSATTRIPPELRQRIAAALLSPEGAAATATLRAGFADQNLTGVAGKEYDELGLLLRDIWGLEL